MLKKLFVAIGALSFVPVSFAYQALYVGAGFGGITGTVEYSTDEFSLTPTNSDYTDTAWLGQLNVGYASTWEDFFAGIEIGAEFADLDLNQSQLQTQGSHSLLTETKTSLDHTYYAVIRPGIEVDERSFFYLLGGIVQGKFSVTDTVSNNNDNSVTRFEDEEDATGYRLGLGFTGPINEYFAWRLEYSYSDYGTFEHDVIDAQDNLSRFKRDTATHQLVLGLLLNS